MSRILKSIVGKHLGLDHNMALLAPKGLVSGNHGNQFHTTSPNKVVLFDDFTNDVAPTATVLNSFLLTEGTDSATSVASILAGGIGGVLRLTTGDAGTGLAADTIQMTQVGLMWQASNGGLVFQTRLKLSAITTCWVYLGFTDTVAAALEAPIESAASANTITTTASDAVGFFFDTRMTDDKWWTAGVAANVDATHYNTTYAPVADKYATFRIEVSTTGVATFFYNGLQVGTTMAGAVTAATDLTPIIAASKTSVAASMTVDVDYVYVGMNRGTYGDSF